MLLHVYHPETHDRVASCTNRTVEGSCCSFQHPEKLRSFHLPRKLLVHQSAQHRLYKMKGELWVAWELKLAKGSWDMNDTNGTLITHSTASILWALSTQGWDALLLLTKMLCYLRR